jgi:hypothetical protein
MTILKAFAGTDALDGNTPADQVIGLTENTLLDTSITELVTSAAALVPPPPV